ncbi:unnamed protein product [Paramecium octaurelia]|uniref:Protein kinase domain-containing protein n=1 Tax=Paramecium octaurelia TaxID=43137 RepID=A0A8S1XDL3_PAROT|nr:unnamed protein product [Paramecium octaurelia]
MNPPPSNKIINCPGKRVSDYLFVKEIGKGAFGQVFQAKNLLTNEVVAIKCIPRSKLTDHGGIVGQLIQSEVEVLRQINNQHVVRLVQYLESANQCYIVLEYCNSGDFEQLWQSRNKKIPENEAINYMKQVLAGMQALHEKNILHRDLKLANILIHNSTLKIADLGFCKQLSDPNQKEKLSLGSLGNMAPEVVEQQPYGMAADMFSIGSMFYQLIFGQFPFTNQSQQKFLDDINNNKPNFRRNGLVISQELECLLERMLMKDPNRRLKWSELYSHPLMQQKDLRYAQLNLNAIQADLINTKEMEQFYKQKDQNKMVEKPQDILSRLNINKQQEFQINRAVSQQLIEDEGTPGQLEDNIKQVEQLQQNMEQQIQEDKLVEQYIDKYMRLRDEIVYVSRTLNEAYENLGLDQCCLICLLLAKKIYILNERLTKTLLEKDNIFQINDRILIKIYAHQHFEKFIQQIVEETTFAKDYVTYFAESLQQQPKLFQNKQSWHSEINKEISPQFNLIFKEVLNDFVFKLMEKTHENNMNKEYDEEKKKQTNKHLFQLQIHLIDCSKYDKIYNQHGKVNIYEQFDGLANKPVFEQQQLAQQRFDEMFD